jgi:hypothetical protein
MAYFREALVYSFGRATLVCKPSSAGWAFHSYSDALLDGGLLSGSDPHAVRT